MKQSFKELLLLLFIVFAGTMSMAQQKTVTGSVKDNQGNPISGASVLEKGTNNGVSTDESGNFTIPVKGDQSVLLISAVNFTNKEMTVGANSTLAIALTAGSGSLNEVVVTALGIKRQKKSLGYAVQEIKGKSLADAYETNLTNALVGKVAGLQIMKSSNGAGASAKIVLRGFTSLTGDNQPLIVVDGVPINNFTGTTENGYWGAGYDMGNGLGDISADDIESMSVLKGPSSAALYGSRAGNGVILITTKSGRRQTGLGLNIGATWGIESIFTKPEQQNVFGQGSQGIYDKLSLLSWGPKAEGQTISKWDGSEGPMHTYDNVDNYVRNGTSQNYNVSFQQQYGNTGIYTSFNRLEDKSILPGNKMTRTNLLARATTKFGKQNRWSTDTKIQYNNTAGFNRPINGRDNSSTYVLNMLPRSIDIREFADHTNEFGDMKWFYPAASAANPYWRADKDLYRDSRDRFIMTGALKYSFTDWLEAEIKGGADMFTNNVNRKMNSGSPSPRKGSFSTSKQTFSETNYSALVTGKKDNLFGKFGGNVSVGGNLMTQKNSSLGVTVTELEVPNLFSINNGTTSPTLKEELTEKKINSVYGTLGVNYNGYLFLDATFRNDWSSALIKANRSYFYPSVSLSYVISDMIETNGGSMPGFLSYAKLRGSYAQVGNDMAPYQLFNIYSIGKDPLGNSTANTGNPPPAEVVFFDPTVVNELIKNLEFGAELRFFRNKIGLDFSWYKSNSTNQLIKLPLDPMSGFASRMINAGDIQNTGIELMLDARILDNPGGLSWNLTANYSSNKNEVIDIADNRGVKSYSLGGYDDVSVRAVSGGLYGEIWGTKFNRVKDIASPYYNQIILDADGLPTRDPEIVRVGSQQAKAMFGVTNSFQYKGFGLSFQVDARFGGEIFSASQVGLHSAGTAKATAPNGAREDFIVDGVMSDGAGGFSKSTKSVTQQNYWGRVSTANNLGVTEAFLYDASNVRLRNVQLSYSLPKSILGKTAIQRARINISCNNVWMISSHMLGLDPESTFATGSNAVGFENGAPPTMRSFLVGIQLGF